MNIFTCGEEISKLTVWREKILLIKNCYTHFYSANLSISQNIFKIAPSKNIFQKIPPSKKKKKKKNWNFFFKKIASSKKDSKLKNKK